MYKHVKVETLSGMLNAILGGNVNNVMLHVNAATLRGLTSFICVLYNVVSENHSVQNSPWGRGVYSHLKAYISRRQKSIHNFPGGKEFKVFSMSSTQSTFQAFVNPLNKMC